MASVKAISVENGYSMTPCIKQTRQESTLMFRLRKGRARLSAEILDFHFRDMNDSIARLYTWYGMHKAEIVPLALRFDG
jgi:hypothetical protein